MRSGQRAQPAGVERSRGGIRAGVVRCAAGGVDAHAGARDLDYAAFLAHLERTNDPAWRYLVNFDRDPVFGVSIGHFSPLGGYDAASGLVTLLDVTPGYGMSLIPAPLLYEAITTVDPDSGLGRGLVAVRLDAATP